MHLQASLVFSQATALHFGWAPFGLINYLGPKRQMLKHLSAITSFLSDIKAYWKDPKTDKSLRGALAQYHGAKVQVFDWHAWFLRTRNLLLFACVLPFIEVGVDHLFHLPVSGLRFGGALCMGVGFALTYPALATYGECFQCKGKRTSVHIMDSFMWAGLVGILPSLGVALVLGGEFFARFL